MITKFEGTADEIKEKVTKAVAEQTKAIHERGIAVLIVEELGNGGETPASDARFKELMAEADKDSVAAGNMDDSRDAMYTRMEGE